jgi:hypothetical protein
MEWLKDVEREGSILGPGLQRHRSFVRTTYLVIKFFLCPKMKRAMVSEYETCNDPCPEVTCGHVK